MRPFGHGLTVEVAADEVGHNGAPVALADGFTEAGPQFGRVGADDVCGSGVSVGGSVLGHEPSIGGGLPPRPVPDTVVDIHREEAAMSRYTRPATTRTYDQIQADISEATGDLARNEATGVEFWRVQAEHCERLENLWNEIVFQAVYDKSLPRWAGFAAMTTRDYYAQQVRDARREAS